MNMPFKCSAHGNPLVQVDGGRWTYPCCVRAGWLIFGTEWDKPLSRAIPQTEWPDLELTNGVAHIDIHSSGDDPTVLFVEVRGIDRESCMGAYLMAHRLCSSEAMVPLYETQACLPLAGIQS